MMKARAAVPSWWAMVEMDGQGMKRLIAVEDIVGHVVSDVPTFDSIEDADRWLAKLGEHRKQAVKEALAKVMRS